MGLGGSPTFGVGWGEKIGYLGCGPLACMVWLGFAFLGVWVVFFGLMWWRDLPALREFDFEILNILTKSGAARRLISTK